MASGYEWRARRFLRLVCPFLFKRGPVCTNWHWRWARYCCCCVNEHHVGGPLPFHGGVWDFRRKHEITVDQYRTEVFF